MPRPSRLLVVLASAALTTVSAVASGGPAAANSTVGPAGTESPAPSPSPTQSIPPPTPTATESTPVPTPTATEPPGLPCAPPPEIAPPAEPYGSSLVQDQIVDVAHAIVDLVDAGGYTGFTGLIADPDRARLELCWLRGEALPSPVAAIVADPGVPILVERRDADYSYADLAGRVPAILGDETLGGQIGGGIHKVTVPEEGTGLIASVRPDDPGVDPAQFAAQAEPVLSAAAGVPVRVVVEDPVEPATRRIDTSPWFGGARLTDNPGTGACSSGFGMLRGRTHYLLTAWHCYGAQAVFNGAPVGNALRQQIGTVRIGVAAADSEAIEIAAPGTAGASVYTGGVGDATEGSIPVTGVGVNIPNLLVCTSGSFSGENCLLRVTRGNIFFVQVVRGVRHNVGPVVNAVSIRRGPPAPVAVARGDSGGPVILRGESMGRVDAMGTIIGGSRFRMFACAVYDATTCFTDVYYNHMGPLLRAYGGNLA